jgi:hypothetical protein
MNRALWQRLDQSLNLFDLSDQRHREALDLFVSQAQARPLDVPACERAERMTRYTQTDREVAARLLAESARDMLSEHTKEVTETGEFLARMEDPK